jgi:hypothetical protein
VTKSARSTQQADWKGTQNFDRKTLKGIEHVEVLGTDVRITFRHLHVIECGGVD